jgi:hypothetical protein
LIPFPHLPTLSLPLQGGDARADRREVILGRRGRKEPAATVGATASSTHPVCCRIGVRDKHSPGRGLGTNRHGVGKRLLIRRSIRPAPKSLPWRGEKKRGRKGVALIVDTVSPSTHPVPPSPGRGLGPDRREVIPGRRGRKEMLPTVGATASSTHPACPCEGRDPFPDRGSGQALSRERTRGPTVSARESGVLRDDGGRPACPQNRTE